MPTLGAYLARTRVHLHPARYPWTQSARGAKVGSYIGIGTTFGGTGIPTHAHTPPFTPPPHMSLTDGAVVMFSLLCTDHGLPTYSYGVCCSVASPQSYSGKRPVRERRGKKNNLPTSPPPKKFNHTPNPNTKPGPFIEILLPAHPTKLFLFLFFFFFLVTHECVAPRRHLTPRLSCGARQLSFFFFLPLCPWIPS